jgi:hypothetical protein
MLRHPGEDQIIPDISHDNPQLQSVKEVTRYHIQASDTDIGNVEDFIADLDTCIIRYIVIDTIFNLPELLL